MFRYKSYEKTITIAVIIILLCLVSIVGVTLALFTNDIEDGTIGINATAGKLKLDIVDDIDPTDSLVGDYLYFATPDGEELEVLFEPGALYYTEGFRVVNKGNIDMKYIVYISADELFNGTDFLEAFDVWITDQKPTDRNVPENLEELQNFSGKLARDEISDTYYLVIKMKESAGNKFNKPGNLTYYEGIGITVCAVQGNGPLDK